jgi:predicted alpha/beta-fold hydrolase
LTIDHRQIHGFADALDYYRQCSAMPRLSDITKPTLIIHAKDDPFMDHHSIPRRSSCRRTSNISSRSTAGTLVSSAARCVSRKCGWKNASRTG